MPNEESPTRKTPALSRSFSTTRHVLRLVLVIAVVVPLLSLLGYGYLDYTHRTSNVSEAIDRLARVEQEHAAEVLHLNREMALRVLDMLNDSDDTTLRAHEPSIHAKLSGIAGDFPQVATISVFGADGKLLANSSYFPAPMISIAGKHDFSTARANSRPVQLSLPLLGKIAEADAFATNIGRFGTGGTFLGMVSIALRREYFSKFYQELTGGDPALILGLVRQDGAILVRYPDITASGAPAVSPTLQPSIARALQDNPASGHATTTAAVDGAGRMYSFRRVGDVPLYAVSGYATGVIFEQWWRHYALVSTLTLLPCVAVWMLVVFSLHHLTAEQIAWEQWQKEIRARSNAEESARQSQRMSALGNLVSNVAHDFNNLLMVVSANIEIARRKGYNNLEHEVLTMKRAMINAESLTRRLLSVARKQPLKQHEVDFSSWLPAVTAIVQTSVGSQVRLELHIEPEVWKVYVDPTELELAIINIAVNARDATPTGGRFTIRCCNGNLPANGADVSGDEFVILSFTDDGEGMDQDTVRRAFEPLFTTKVRGAGTGLGLAQVLATFEQMGGTARIESVAGLGTTVRLYLPRYKGPADQKLHGETSAKRPETPVSGSTVLLVEDNAEVAAGIAAVLEVFGCHVHHEMSADAALHVLDSGKKFDVILTEVHMPGRLNGIDLVERVRRSWPAQKVALMTGYADELERAERLDVPILAKPFDMEELSALISGRPT
ncbi:hybrid sensor histidine kinase/response regulator [Caballeronia telluris]|uniref:histidine kinase n=1 Tax=Caballeronia telluris TaxID=326475 RepID=A0A158KDR3_9BURK|nr:hybrid sensor histidine kinase/response regulator [Caballeronia telluris]SAL79227.1 integral membrane sensor hybrid histidine kinase [Caballeronia telluris]